MTTTMSTQLFIFFLTIVTMTKIYLNLRNKNHILANKKEVPEEFSEKISLEDHQKAAKYSVAKGEFGRFSTIFSAIITYLWVLGGGLKYLDQAIAHFELNNIFYGVTLFLAFSFINLIIDLPLSYYSTFVIEEKFGFNKMTPKLFFQDLIKQLALGLILGVPLLYGVLALLEYLGDNWWFYAFLLVTTFQFLLLWIYPTIIAPLFNKFSPLTEGEIRDRIEALAKRINFQLAGISIMDASKRSSHGNAYFTGLGKNKKIVFFDTLLKTLNPSEVEAVLAHELGHFKRKHILKNIIRATVMSFIFFYIMNWLIHNQTFYDIHGNQPPKMALGLLLISIVAPVYTFFITPLSSWWSRKYEYEADEFAAKNSSADDLISALIKMYRDNASTLTPDELFSHFYHSHPTAMERIRFLKSFNTGRP